MTSEKKYLYDISNDPNHVAYKILPMIGHGQSLLEVGCASGVQTRLFKERLDCKVTGIEIDSSAAEDARPFCEKLVIGNIENLELSEELAGQRFDAVIFADVLEHLYRPADALAKVRPFIKPGGNLIASVPNITHASICWEIAHGRFSYRKFGLLDSTHIRFFSKRTLSELFDQAGYRILSLDRVIKFPHETEFGVHCASKQDKSFLEWIDAHNPEANTYQFVVRATPITGDSETLTGSRSDAIATIEQLEAQIGELEHQKRTLRSHVNWLEQNRFGAVSRLINRIRKNRT